MTTLYKKDSKGKILEWEVDYQLTAQSVNIIIQYGELEGKKAKQIRTGIKGKNLGKANETSPLEQAKLEIEALIKKKKREGYKGNADLRLDPMDVAFGNFNLRKYLEENLSFDTRDLDGNLKPMKCQQYYRSKKNWTDPTGRVWTDRKYFYILNPHFKKESGAIIIKFPCLIQPKINGVRCTVSLDSDNKVQLLSKDGLKYNLPHISQIFESFKERFDTTIDGKEYRVIFDGELYIHGESLQNIGSAVDKPNLNTPRVIFVAFDLAIPEVPNLTRIQIMKELLNFSVVSLEFPITYVTTYKVGNDELVQRYTDNFIADGYEGSILRDINGTYAFGKRPMTMTKLKRIIDEEFTIIDIVPQDKDPHLGLYICRDNKGNEFKVTPTLSDNEKQAILLTKHMFIGKKLTCKFYEYTDKGIPFHIINNVIRDYE